MPIGVRFDADARLLYVTVAGAWPGIPEIAAERSRIISSGVIHPRVTALLDLRAVTSDIPTVSDLRAMLDAIGRPPHKRAILVSTTGQLGVARFAELLDPLGLQVFHRESEALAWLLAPEPRDPLIVFDRGGLNRLALGRNVRL